MRLLSVFHPAYLACDASGYEQTIGLMSLCVVVYRYLLYVWYVLLQWSQSSCTVKELFSDEPMLRHQQLNCDRPLVQKCRSTKPAKSCACVKADHAMIRIGRACIGVIHRTHTFSGGSA